METESREKVAKERRLFLRDDGDINIGAGAEIVEDASENGVAGELDGLVPGEVGLPLGLKDAHGGEGAAAHGDVGQFVGAAVGVDGEEVGAGGIAAGDDEVGANVALVAKEVLLEHGHAGDDAWLTAGRERVQFELRRDERRRELGVGGRAGAGAPNLRRNVVQLLTILVGDDGARRGSRIGGNHDTTIEYASDNGRAGTGGFWQRHAACVQGRIAVVVGKVKPGHRGWMWWASKRESLR